TPIFPASPGISSLPDMLGRYNRQPFTEGIHLDRLDSERFLFAVIPRIARMPDRRTCDRFLPNTRKNCQIRRVQTDERHWASAAAVQASSRCRFAHAILTTNVLRDWDKEIRSCDGFKHGWHWGWWLLFPAW